MVNPYQWVHEQFVDPMDRIQTIYERARKAVWDRRVQVSGKVWQALRTNGIAGLFLEPDRSLISCSTSATQGGLKQQKAKPYYQEAHLSEQHFDTIARSLTECVGVRATARIQEVNPKTVLRVLDRAAEHAVKVSSHLLKGIKVSECQLDEMWSFIGKKEYNLDPIEKLAGILGDAWIWIAFDSLHKIVLAHVVGKRTEPHAVCLLGQVKQVTAGMPTLFSSDQLDQYKNALLKVYGVPALPPKRKGPGRPPRPKIVPPKDLLYVQVVKKYKQNRVVNIDRRIIFGDPDRIAEVLHQSKVSRAINTSYVERNNATIRHIDARCTRKTYRFSKLHRNHIRQLDLSLAYYHLCLPHRTLTKQHKQPTTPFMSAGITNHVWTMHELLQYDPEKPMV